MESGIFVVLVTPTQVRTASPPVLREGESHVLSVIGAEWMHTQAITRETGYRSASHVRQLISNLCDRGLLERGKRGTYRRKPGGTS